MQYALAASDEALKDSGWRPVREPEKEMTVSVALFPGTGPPLTSRIRVFALAQALAASRKSTIHP